MWTNFIGPSIVSIPLENNGRKNTKGNHFEKVLFGNAMMTSETSKATIISVFSLALLKDSGFYEVDMFQAEEFYWGKNAGCNFVTYFCNGKFDYRLILWVKN